MASSTVARLARATAVAVFLLTLTAVVPVAAQSDQKITICQATGSPSNPWVFTTIDARDLPEHLARGDYRANSIADCSAARAPGAATPVAAVAATAPPSATPTATRAPVQQQGVAGSVPLPDVPVSRLVGAQTTPTPSPRTAAPAANGTAAPAANGTAAPASATARPTVNVAGAQATPAPEVSTLPKSGGEPDHTVLVLGLLGLIGAGLGLRRLGRAQG